MESLWSPKSADMGRLHPVTIQCLAIPLELSMGLCSQSASLEVVLREDADIATTQKQSKAGVETQDCVRG